MTQTTPDTPVERLGGVLFRWRDYTALPPLILFLAFAKPTLMSILAGGALMAFGEAIRVWANAHIGGASRTRGNRPGAALVMSGPFRLCRNPLYVGNLFLTLGAAAMSGRAWFVAAAFAFFAAQYGPVVRWEEARLREQFGEEYVAFCAFSPRWFPRFGGVRADQDVEPLPIRRVAHIERRTALAIVVVIGLFAARSLI